MRDPLWRDGSGAPVERAPIDADAKERSLGPSEATGFGDPTGAALAGTRASKVAKELGLREANPLFLGIILGRRLAY
jgi:hypothetical protein